jgi:hypothetical protein
MFERAIYLLAESRLAFSAPDQASLSRPRLLLRLERLVAFLNCCIR